MTRNRTLLSFVGVALFTIGLIAWSAPAGATTSTHCGHSGGVARIDHDVAGSVYVPAGTWCSIHSDLTIQGSVLVARGGRIDLHRDQVGGNVVASSDAIVTVADRTEIAGSVRLTHTFIVRFIASTVSGDLTGTINSSTNVDAQMSLGTGTVIDGKVDLAAPLTQLYARFDTSGAAIHGDARLNNLEVEGPGPLQVGGSMVLDRLSRGFFPLICGVSVASNLTVEYAAKNVVWGGFAGCGFPNSIGGSLLAHDNVGRLLLSGPIGGDAVCRNNVHNPRQIHPDDPALAVTIGGRGIEECANLVPTG